jgi:hypothetical protein
VLFAPVSVMGLVSEDLELLFQVFGDFREVFAPVAAPVAEDEADSSSAGYHGYGCGAHVFVYSGDHESGQGNHGDDQAEVVSEGGMAWEEEMVAGEASRLCLGVV